MNCGVVMMVRDERFDVSAWISWHIVIGFTTIIIYDDFSTDGTWEYLSSLSYDGLIIQRALLPEEDNFQLRQKACYEDALDRAGSLCDWLAFIDSDEMLDFSDEGGVQEYLGRFEDFDAVAINWCMYGSNSHVLKPRASMAVAYRAHSREDFPTNRHVKCIVRPAAARGKYLNQHAFDLIPERYADSTGVPVRWSKTPGIVEAEVNWTLAKVRHYQCRSVEDFVIRARRRTDISYKTHDLFQLDRNEIRDCPSSQKKTLAAHNYCRAMENWRSKVPCVGLLSDLQADAECLCVHEGLFKVSTCHSTEIIALPEGQLAHSAVPSTAGICIMFSTDIPEVGFLVSRRANLRLRLEGVKSESADWIRVITRFGEAGRFSIQTEPYGMYLRAELGTDRLILDAVEPKEWEKFSLVGPKTRIS